MHWLCIEAMHLTYQLASMALPDWVHIDSQGELTRWLDAHHSQSAIISARAFYSPELESQYDLQLPHSWDVTSDSLAAQLAMHIQAHEVVLLKSCDIDNQQDNQHELIIEPGDLDQLQILAARGIVDRALPRISNLPVVRLVNLRSPIWCQ